MENSKEKNDELDEQEKQAIALYSHVKELGILKYEAELKREDSLIQQSSHMQTAFAFMSAAVFMLVPIILEYRGSLSLIFFFLSISSIVLFLLISLVTASAAQFRRKFDDFPDIEEIEKHVEDNWKSVLDKSQQLKQYVKLLGTVQKSKAKGNDRRVLLIRISMWNFMASLGLVVFWFILAICKII